MFLKIYCEISDPIVLDGQSHCLASWLGFRFMDWKINNVSQVPSEKIALTAGAGYGDELLHYRYIPRTGEWGTADVSSTVLTPYDPPNCIVNEGWEGDDTVKFHRAICRPRATLGMHFTRRSRKSIGARVSLGAL